MSEKVTASSDWGPEVTYPPVSSAKETSPGNRPRAWFDDGITFAIKEEARRRAPNTETVWRHQVGLSGELTGSGYFQSPLNRDVYPDYEGDDGYDLEIQLCDETWRVETKTVCDGDLELVVDRNRVDQADYFLLCQTEKPLAMTEIIGCINRRNLKRFGEKYPDDSKIRVDPKYLQSLEPLHISPERIRNAQVNL